jgi:hypothetical protein
MIDDIVKTATPYLLAALSEPDISELVMVGVQRLGDKD